MKLKILMLLFNCSLHKLKQLFRYTGFELIFNYPSTINCQVNKNSPHINNQADIYRINNSYNS